jgi:hypothetical protein
MGMDTKQVVARFEAERQALAMMDHPNIAKVLDAGMTESRPEDEWQALGLHGLSDRRLAKRIEALASERVQKQREIQAAFRTSALVALPSAATPGDGFAEGVWRAVSDAKPARDA